MSAHRVGIVGLSWITSEPSKPGTDPVLGMPIHTRIFRRWPTFLRRGCRGLRHQSGRDRSLHGAVGEHMAGRENLHRLPGNAQKRATRSRLRGHSGPLARGGRDRGDGSGSEGDLLRETDLEPA